MEGLRPVHWLASLLAVLLFCHGELLDCLLSRSCSYCNEIWMLNPLIGMSLATNLGFNRKADWLQRTQNCLWDYVDVLFFG